MSLRGMEEADSKSEPTEGDESEFEVLSQGELIYRLSSLVCCATLMSYTRKKNDVGRGGGWGTTGD